MYEIEKNIKFEKTVSNQSKYPFIKMEIGDSFVVSGNEKFIVRAAAYEHAKRTGTKFKTKSISDEQTRIWRTE